MRAHCAKIAAQVILVSALAFLVIGCGESGSSGSGVGSIQLSASSLSIPADGSSSTGIQATLVDEAGQPPPAGTDIRFSTSLGKFSTSGKNTTSKRTLDDTGTVNVSLISGNESGTATVVCDCGGISQSINIALESAAITVGKIDVRVAEASIAADGVSQTDVIATVKSSDNQAVEGAEVIFKTDLGSIASPATTDESGRAVTTLISDRFNKSRVVVGAESQGVSDTASLSFTGVTMDLAAQPQSLIAYIPANPEENHSKTRITATLRDAADLPIVNEAIEFQADRGEFTDGSGMVLESSVVNTDANGIAEIYLKSSRSGDANVTAIRSASVTTPKLTGKSTVNFNKFLFQLTSAKSSIEVGGETTDLRIQITDTETNQGVAGAEVVLSSTLGRIIPYTVTTNQAGIAYATLRSGNQSGLSTVDARAYFDSGDDELVLTDQVFVLFKAISAGKILLTADPGVIKVNSGTSILQAKVYDGNDNPVSVQPVYFEILNSPGDDDLYIEDSMVMTDNAGIAETTLYAGSLPSDSTLIAAYTDPETDPYNPGSNQPIDTTAITVAGPVANVSVSVNLHELIEPALEQGHLEVGVSAIATDINGNPVADGTPVIFGVRSIGFDEDRDNDFTIDCWSAGRSDAPECSGAGCNPFGGNPCFDAAGLYPTEILGQDWFTDDVDLDGNMYNTGGVMAPAEDANNNGLIDCEDLDGDRHLDVGEDLDSDRNLDVDEDVDNDGRLDVDEDLDNDGNLDVNEDVDGDGRLDINEDLDGDGKLDTVNEDLDGDGHLDTVNEDVDGDGKLDANEDVDGDGNLDINEDVDGDGNLDVDEDLDGDNRLDVGEDLNCNGVLDPGEDANGNGLLELTELAAGVDIDGDGDANDVYEDVDGDCRLDIDEDVDGDGRLDRVHEDVDGDGVLDIDEDLDNDCRLDDQNEDIDGDGNLDVNEDVDGDGRLDVAEDIDGDGRLDTENEDVDRDGRLDVDEDLDGDGKLDTINEDIDGDGVLDPNEDLDGDGRFDVDEDRNNNGRLDPGEDIDGDGRLDVDEDLDNDGHFDDVNEDTDRNGLLNCEDKNGNGVLDPPTGVDIDSPVETEAGVARTKLYYPMSFAENVQVRISAEAGGVSGFYEYVLLCTEDMVEQGTCGDEY